jgi:phenol hydroxylase P0 protein
MSTPAMSSPEPESEPIEGTDTSQRFVRFYRVTERGFVEFAFGIGSRDLMVDLVLPVDAFRSFCLENRVQEVTPEQGVALDHEQAKWRYGAPGVTE